MIERLPDFSEYRTMTDEQISAVWEFMQNVPLAEPSNISVTNAVWARHTAIIKARLKVTELKRQLAQAEQDVESVLIIINNEPTPAEMAQEFPPLTPAQARILLWMVEENLSLSYTKGRKNPGVAKLGGDGRLLPVNAKESAGLIKTPYVRNPKNSIPGIYEATGLAEKWARVERQRRRENSKV